MGILRKKTNTGNEFFGAAYSIAYAVCYRLGLSVIRKIKSLKRSLSKVTASVFAFLKNAVTFAKSPIKKAFSYLKRELNSVYRFLFAAPVHVIKHASDAYRDGGFKESVRCVANIFHNTRTELFKSLGVMFSYLLPVCSVAVLVVAVYSNSAENYAIRVSCNDYVLGFIEDEKVFYEGESLMRERIQYSEGEKAYYFIPQFEMVRESEIDEYSDSYMICNELIRTSGNVFSSAYGLYVDGVFYGATIDGAALGQELDALLNSYSTGAENEIVRFHNDVVIREGLYLDSSIVELSELEALIDSKVDYEATYTVVQNDSPYRIAAKNGISFDMLVALNPEITESCYIGQQVIVSEERPLLSVETVVTEQKEIKVDYDSVTIPDSSMSYGSSYVTRKGQKGTAIQTVEKVYVAGILVETNVVGTEVVTEPVTEYVKRGTYMATSIKPSQGDGSFDFEFKWPTKGGYQTCAIDGYSGHTGMDIGGLPIGTPIYASAAGTVIKSVKNTYGYGYHIIIDHGNGVQTLYAHCSKLYAKVGDQVEQGDKIALLGATGNAQGKHLHFEIRINGEYKDPADYIGTTYRKW